VATGFLIPSQTGIDNEHNTIKGNFIGTYMRMYTWKCSYRDEFIPGIAASRQ
jgi:hypothetical protein